MILNLKLIKGYLFNWMKISTLRALIYFCLLKQIPGWWGCLPRSDRVVGVWSPLRQRRQYIRVEWSGQGEIVKTTPKLNQYIRERYPLPFPVSVLFLSDLNKVDAVVMGSWCNGQLVVWAFTFIANLLLSSLWFIWYNSFCQIPARYTSTASNIRNLPITPGLL